jgi:hypothetical protein
VRHTGPVTGLLYLFIGSNNVRGRVVYCLIVVTNALAIFLLIKPTAC